MPRPLKIKLPRNDIFEFTLVLTKEQGQTLVDTAKRQEISVHDLIVQHLMPVIDNSLFWVTSGLLEEDWEALCKLGEDAGQSPEETADFLLHDAIVEAGDR